MIAAITNTTPTTEVRRAKMRSAAGSLALAKEGICAALNGAETLLCALLKQNNNDQEQACDDHDNRKSDLCGRHTFFPPFQFFFYRGTASASDCVHDTISYIAHFFKGFLSQKRFDDVFQCIARAAHVDLAAREIDPPPCAPSPSPAFRLKTAAQARAF